MDAEYLETVQNQSGITGPAYCRMAKSRKIFHKNDRNEWRWQRPRLFGTTEDLYTQSIVVPYLIPMLENAGAVVFHTT